jgi:hypothetical protein
VTCFSLLFQIFKKLSELDTGGGYVRADFDLNRSGDSLEIRAREKKRKKTKFGERKNIILPKFCKNGNIMNKESIDFYVLEDARLNGTTAKQLGQLVQPEINMADEKKENRGRRSNHVL